MFQLLFNKTFCNFGLFSIWSKLSIFFKTVLRIHKKSEKCLTLLWPSWFFSKISQNCKNCIKEHLKHRFSAFKCGINDFITAMGLRPMVFWNIQYLSIAIWSRIKRFFEKINCRYTTKKIISDLRIYFWQLMLLTRAFF